MQFEYDFQKSLSNVEKHGIGFEEARRLWEDEWRVISTLEYAGERREMIVARHAGACWTAIYTMRDGAVRIISVRRSTKKEVAHYDHCRNS